MGRRVFVSYSREDVAWRDAFRQMLGPVLERYGVQLWADDHIRSGDRWERVIGEALAGAELGLLLVTPAFLVSSFVWGVEVPALLAAGVPLVWVLVEECLWEDVELLASLQGVQDPRRDGALADHSRRTWELARVCRKIRDEHLVGLRVAPPAAVASAPAQAAVGSISPARPGRVFGAVPKRPGAFVGRGAELEDLRTAVVSGLSGAVGVTGRPAAVGLQGRGGIGKTVLAAELTRDPETLAYFPDGVFWVSLGERADVVGAQRQLVGWLGGEAEAIRSPLQGAKVLRELLVDRQCLVVADDVWSVGVAQALAVTGPRGRLLVTTRDRVLLGRLGARAVELDVLGIAAARELLGQLAGVAPGELPVEAEGILAATGRVALAVALVGAAIGRGGQGWAEVAARLGEASEMFAGHAYADAFKALEVATSELPAEELDRYQALACFPEDTVVPPSTVGRLWGIPEGDQLRRFAELGLLRLEAGGVAFHDLQRDYLLLHAEAVALAHEQLLAAHDPGADGWYQLDPDDPYLWDQLTYHLAAAGRHHELIATVTDAAWLAARITHDGTLAAERDVSDALRWEPAEPRLQALLRRLQQTAHLLDRASGADQVVATLGTHLWPLRDALDLNRLDRIAPGARLEVAWITDTTSPQLIRTITAHAALIGSVAWSPDGTRLASAGGDGTVRVWDVATGVQLQDSEGQRNAVIDKSSSRSVVVSADGTWRVFPSGAQLQGWEDKLSARVRTAWSPDNTHLALAHGREDGTVQVWDATTGSQLRVLSGHTGQVWSVAWAPDGTGLASTSEDGTVRVWDVTTGAQLRILSGHAGGVWLVAWAPGGTQVASAGEDGTVRVWDVATGSQLRVLSPPMGWMRRVVWSADGTRLATAGELWVRAWDVTTGAQVLDGNVQSVESMAWSPDGTRLASASEDGTVRVWAVATGAKPQGAAGHAGRVSSVAWSPDGARLASAGEDGTVRVWDAASGAARQVLKGLTDWVAVGRAAWSPDGAYLALVGGKDLMSWVWDVASGVVRQVMGRIGTVAWSPDGTWLALGSGQE